MGAFTSMDGYSVTSLIFMTCSFPDGQKRPRYAESCHGQELVLSEKRAQRIAGNPQGLGGADLIAIAVAIGSLDQGVFHKMMQVLRRIRE